MKAFSLANAGQPPVTGEPAPAPPRVLPAGCRGATSSSSPSGRHLRQLVRVLRTPTRWTKSRATCRSSSSPELGVPPSIQKESAPQVNVAEAITPPTIGVPEPVPDAEATESTIATQSEMSDALAPITASDMMGGGNDAPLVVDNSHAPGPASSFPSTSCRAPLRPAPGLS